MEMVVVIAIIVAISAPFVVRWHLVRSTRRLKVADQAWGSLEQHAHALFQDKTLDPVIGDFVEQVLKRVGDGSLTRHFLIFIAFKPSANGVRESEFGKAFEAMEDGQHKQLARFMIDSIFYDSLRTSLSGSILRRIVLYWLEATARDEGASVSAQQIRPIAAAARHTFGVRTAACS